ncbi:ABC transporter substrate-binding protein [Mycolicibacterium boenickei]|uniref:ABC transporter substrate-binding protein n=1 Tax=Mycolicibacterium boenickei TaxID=146017 RepID=A0AAX2ZUS4_9MYCO|nr:ABC transporter substrate-binding protein [Mycolicibacterium boenickei]PEG58919.1 ABC transporter substrate-binding protein [Mycolicibacterium boenickei]UNB98860.1 ABC transporter substrate-binding protein [Mycolicibacterium boenickei]BBX88430.1 ABC transporter substrate-binding protein [Mycolicibacterium boenickei]
MDDVQHHPRGRWRARSAALLAAVTVSGAQLLTGCGLLTEPTVVVNVGYQSKTINTVNAGTLLRDRGDFENALKELGAATGTKYRVVWQDFASGAPLTAQMIATHVDIGSMGDYPLLTNGSKTRKYDDAVTEMVATTGYNLRGSLNQVVVPSDSPAEKLGDLTGKKVSTSLGSAGDGMFSSAVRNSGMDKAAVHIVNQDPSVGASAIDGGQVDGLAQFVPWPQLVIYRNQGRLLYDGGDNNVPTFHGVVVRKQFAEGNPEVMAAFLRAMKSTTDDIVAHPLAAAKRVGELTGIEPEVIYLYNGPNGLVSFDMTLKEQFLTAFASVKEYLVGRGSVTKDFDVAGFVNDSYLRQLFGDQYPQRQASVANPMMLTGFDDVCRLPVNDPAQASEVWASGSETTEVAATPTCLLRRVGATPEVRAAYVPDTLTGLRIFADHAVWLDDPTAPPTQRYKPFATGAAADTYRTSHPQAVPVAYPAAVGQSRTAG